MTVNFDIKEMSNRVIFGIPLYDTEGNPFPDDLLQSYMDSAIAWAEQTLGIAIQPRTEEEDHDYLGSDYQNWGYLKLWKKPVLEIESLVMYYGDQKMMEIPKNWIKLDPLTGTVQLFPTSGNAGGLIINAGGGVWQPLISGRFAYAPQMWKVKYTAGMTEPEQKQVYRQTNIHPNLKEIIYKKTAMSVMGVWGDLIIGAGIANQSVSIDGLSQSIGTTQSPMFGGASARIKQLEEDIDAMMPALRSYYSGINMTVI
ncbi:hypothetical protein [Bacillus phage YungSlug]|nr:hypothetical protein [Bacillus phage YungSlug]